LYQFFMLAIWRASAWVSPAAISSATIFSALLEHVGAALQEQHPEDVFLELGGIHLAAQDVGGLEQVAFQLWEGQGHGWKVALARNDPSMARAEGDGSGQSFAGLSSTTFSTSIPGR
jgi:hypothetical protein